MARDYVCLYHSYLDAVQALGDAERGRLFTAMLEYSLTGATGHLSGNERFIFPMVKAQIDRDKERYEETCRRRSDSGKLGGRPEKQEKQNEAKKANAFSESKKSKGKGEGKGEGEGDIKEKTPMGSKRKVFVPPTVEQVAEYCQQRNNGIDPAYFVDWYTARGWTYGKGKPIVDWKAAVRTWEHKDSKKEAPDPYDDVI